MKTKFRITIKSITYLKSNKKFSTRVIKQRSDRNEDPLNEQETANFSFHLTQNRQSIEFHNKDRNSP